MFRKSSDVDGVSEVHIVALVYVRTYQPNNSQASKQACEIAGAD